jgi:glutaredoxin
MTAKATKPKIIVWIKPYCPWCQGLLAMLKQRGFAFQSRDVIGHERYHAEMVQLTHQEKAPCVSIDGTLLIDTSDQEVEAWMKEHGYLKAA